MKVFILRFLVVVGLMSFSGGFFESDAQTITGSIGNGTVSRGKSARAVVVINIPGGLHVNSSRPNSEYAIPTKVRVTGSGLKVGAVSYPRGKDRKFQFSENNINVYEGRVSFPVPVTIPANFRGSHVRVRAVVSYQACTEEVCYPPKSKEITLTAKVR